MMARVGFVRKVKQVWNSSEPQVRTARRSLRGGGTGGEELCWLPWLQVAVEEAIGVDNSSAVLVDLLNVLRQKKWVGLHRLLCVL